MSGSTNLERDELVLSLLDYVTPLLQWYAVKYYRFVSFDDLYYESCTDLPMETTSLEVGEPVISLLLPTGTPLYSRCSVCGHLGHPWSDPCFIQ